MGQALANRLDRTRCETATDILGAAAAFDHLHRFAGLDLADKAEPCVLVRHEPHPFPLKRASNPEANATLPARVAWGNAVSIGRAADRRVVRGHGGRCRRCGWHDGKRGGRHDRRGHGWNVRRYERVGRHAGKQAWSRLWWAGSERWRRGALAILFVRHALRPMLTGLVPRLPRSGSSCTCSTGHRGKIK